MKGKDNGAAELQLSSSLFLFFGFWYFWSFSWSICHYLCLLHSFASEWKITPSFIRPDYIVSISSSNTDCFYSQFIFSFVKTLFFCLSLSATFSSPLFLSLQFLLLSLLNHYFFSQVKYFLFSPNYSQCCCSGSHNNLLTASGLYFSKPTIVLRPKNVFFSGQYVEMFSFSDILTCYLVVFFRWNKIIILQRIIAWFLHRRVA